MYFRGDSFCVAEKAPLESVNEHRLEAAISLCYIALLSVERILEFMREPSVRGPVATRDGVK
jgi:hypothetical protein